ncbi:MAG: LLM class flavin-dependent oxidoreductase [Microthrixaceae bacterium]
MPAIERGLAAAGRPALADPASTFDLTAVTIVVTGRTAEELDRSREAVRQQLAFYGTTPAYRPVFDVHDRGELPPTRRGAAGEWVAMAELIDDEFLEEIAVIGEPHEIAPKIRARLAGITDRVSCRATGPRPRTFRGGGSRRRRGALASGRGGPPTPMPDRVRPLGRADAAVVGGQVVAPFRRARTGPPSWNH